MSSTTETDVKKWAISMELLIEDAIGLQVFMEFLQKEYSFENIKFWLAVNDFKKREELEIPLQSIQIYNEFISPGAQYEINIDGKTKEKIIENMKSPSRFMFDAAAEYVYNFLLKKDSYSRFIRSEYYKGLLANGVQPFNEKSDELPKMDTKERMVDENMLNFLSVPKHDKQECHRQSASSSDKSSHETSSSDDDSGSRSVTERLRCSCCLGDRRHRGSSASRPQPSSHNTSESKSSKDKKHLSLSWSFLDATFKPKGMKITGTSDNGAQECQIDEHNDDIECSTVRVNDVPAAVELNLLGTQ